MKLSSPITMAYPGPPRRAAGLARYLLLAVCITGALFYLRHTAQVAALNSAHVPVEVTPTHLPSIPPPGNPVKPDVKPIESPVPTPAPSNPTPAQDGSSSKKAPHPIDTLIENAAKTYDDLLAKESKDLKSAAAAYRERRGRHPPPGFDAWYKFATENNAVMVEDFFDQIYHDLGPFWGLPPSTMRKESWAYEMSINVRNHNATSGSDWFWTKLWLDQAKTIEHLLPDIDIALNAMDEPRVIVPWEEMNKYMEIERATRKMPPPSEVISEFGTLSPKPDPEVKVRDKNWEDKGMYGRCLTLIMLTLLSSILDYRYSWLSSRLSRTKSCRDERIRFRSHSCYFFRAYTQTHLQRIRLELFTLHRLLPSTRSSIPPWHVHKPPINILVKDLVSPFRRLETTHK